MGTKTVRGGMESGRKSQQKGEVRRETSWVATNFFKAFHISLVVRKVLKFDFLFSRIESWNFSTRKNRLEL